MNTTMDATSTLDTDGLAGWTWTGKVTDAGTRSDNSCGHCGTPIRYLVHVAHTSGRTMHVGTSCAEVVGLTAQEIVAVWREQRRAANEARFAEERAAAKARYAKKLAANEAREAEEAARPKSQHTGTIGQRLTVKGTIQKVIDLEPYKYGAPVPFLIILDIDGNTVITKTTAAWRYGLTRGEHIELTGTVKDHSDYHGTAQTVLTRCKRLDQPTPTPAATTTWATDYDPGHDPF